MDYIKKAPDLLALLVNREDDNSGDSDTSDSEDNGDGTWTTHIV